MKYVLGIDVGCTSVKSVLFDIQGNEITSASAYSEREKVENRGSGFEEYSLLNIWESTKVCVKDTIQKANIEASSIEAIGVTSFGNGIVILDKEGNPLANGAVSQDYRANGIVAEYQKSGAFDKINQIIKGTLFAGEPGPILRWYKENEPEIYSKIGCVMLCKDYIIYKLTGVMGADVNNFGGSAMLDLETVDYSMELMELYGIPEMFDKLPKLMSCNETAGYVTAHAAEVTGLHEGTPVAMGMMDILASLVGAGAYDEGIATIIAGTWCINETQSAKIIPGASANQPALEKGLYLNCSYTGASAVNFEWFNKALGGTAIMEGQRLGITKYGVMDTLISSMSPDKAEVIYLPFVAQPSVHPNAKANFFNIDQNTQYSEMVYALAEGIVFMHKRHIDFLKGAGCDISKGRLTGGIARSSVWAQLFADILQMPIEVVDSEEVGALGAAITAGIAAGIYQDYQDGFNQAVRLRAIFYPRNNHRDAYMKRYAQWESLVELLMPYWDKKQVN